MARKKKNDEDQRHQMLIDSQEIGEQLGLTMQMSKHELANKILKAADSLQSEICEKADSIKVDGFKQFKDMLADTVLVTKGFFFELVDIRRKAMYGELDFDKLTEQTGKIDEGTQWAAKHDEMRKQLLASLRANNGEFDKVLTTAAEADITVETDDAFMQWPDDVKELIDDCAKTRQLINTQLWPKMSKYANAFAVWCDAEPWEFHDLIRWYHYRAGGYPTAGSKPYLWAILDKFQYAIRQCREYGLDFADGYLERFGIEVNIKTDKPDDNAYIWDL